MMEMASLLTTQTITEDMGVQRPSMSRRRRKRCGKRRKILQIVPNGSKQIVFRRRHCWMALVLALSLQLTAAFTYTDDDDAIEFIPQDKTTTTYLNNDDEVSSSSTMNPGTELPEETLRPLTSEETDEKELYLEWARFLQLTTGSPIETLDPDIGNSTNVPTIIDTETPEETENPSAAPTTSAAPTRVTDSPSAFPTATVRPSFSPTTTVSPSHAPTESNAPSMSPQPSPLPSSVPTLEPTLPPSLTPSLAPTITGQPTVTPRPTISQEPTLSQPPTPMPTTEFPSMAPTTSRMPSDTPSFMPSPFPTSSNRPSMSPSVSLAPTISPMPTTTPSVPPTNLPSLMPSQPSEFPSMVPTIVLEEPVTADKIFMVLDGLPALLTPEEIEVWQSVTSQHIIDYWNTLRIEHPEDTPLYVAAVNTTLNSQAEILEQASVIGGDGDETTVIQMMYRQDFAYGVYGDNDPPLEPEILQYYLVLLPFVTNSYEYSNALVDALNLTNFVLVTHIDAGDPPTPAPTPAPEGLSMAAVRAISVSIVVGSCLIVAFLLYDRKRKDHGRFPSDTDSDYDASRHARRTGMDTMEFDNAGQPIDWTNPYSDAAANAAAAGVVRNGTGGATVASAGGTIGNRSGTMSASSHGGSQSGEMPMGPLARATSIRSMPGVGTMNSGTSSSGTSMGMGPPPTPQHAFGGSRHGRRADPASQRATSTGDLPPLAPGGTNFNNNNNNGYMNGGTGRTSGGSGRSPFSYGNSPSRGINIRGTSMTDTEITDLTYSDYLSDARGSDVANLAHLPPISDETLREPGHHEQSASMPFSPMHIPDEEAVEMAGRLSPPSSPIPSVLDLASDIQSPMMTGFDMQIEELE